MKTRIIKLTHAVWDGDVYIRISAISAFADYKERGCMIFTSAENFLVKETAEQVFAMINNLEV